MHSHLSGPKENEDCLEALNITRQKEAAMK
jgi:hypothetical protein